MKKFIIEESEVKRILSMHRVVKEQTSPTTTATPGTATPAAATPAASTPAASTPAASTPAASTPAASTPAVDPSYEKLQKFRAANCFSGGGVMYRNKTKNTYFIRAVKLSTKQEINFFPDMTYSFVDGSKKGKWDCAKIATAQANDKPSQETQTSPQSNAKTAQETQTASKENLERTKKSGNWKERNEISDTNANLENPKMYEKTVVDGVTLYRDVISSGVAEGLTPEQIKVIKKYTDLGYKLRKDLDAEEAQTWSKEVVYPAGTLFSQDLVMYLPPSGVVGADGTKIQDEFTKAVTDQTPESKKDCKDTIEAYYGAWKTKKRVEPNTFLPMKEKVQACVNEFGGKWGIPALTKIDDYVKILKGGIGGPSKMGQDAKWRLN
jgi:hypothetical protein